MNGAKESVVEDFFFRCECCGKPTPWWDLWDFYGLYICFDCHKRLEEQEVRDCLCDDCST